MSACGNFVVVGYASGRIDSFNIQSGLHRRAFGGANGMRKAPTAA